MIGKVFIALWVYLSIGVALNIQGVPAIAFIYYSAVVVTLIVLTFVLFKFVLPEMTKPTSEIEVDNK